MYLFFSNKITFWWSKNKTKYKNRQGMGAVNCIMVLLPFERAKNEFTSVWDTDFLGFRAASQGLSDQCLQPPSPKWGTISFICLTYSSCCFLSSRCVKRVGNTTWEYGIGGTPCLDEDERKSACWKLGPWVGLPYLWKKLNKATLVSGSFKVVFLGNRE